MHLKNLHLTNFRCFADLDLKDLNPSLNLIVGINGSGKSSVLQGVSIAVCRLLPSFSPSISLQAFTKREVTEKDIRLNKDLVYQTPVEIVSEIEISDNQTVTSKTVRGLTQEDNVYYEDIGSVHDFSKWIWESAKAEGNEDIFPVLVYYGTQRLLAEHPNPSGLLKVGRLLAYNAAFDETKPKHTLRNYFYDIQEKQTFEQKKNQDPNFRHPFLFLLEKNLKIVLEEFNLQFIHYRVNKTFPDREDIYLIYEDGTELPLDAHSDGQRNIFWLIFDLTYRCYVLNPFLGTEACEKSIGVVTIDEIDLHLHPQMQSTIIPTLRALFPRLQFFITTHSPLVVSSVRSENIILLADFKVRNDVDMDTYGKSVTIILDAIFEAPVRQKEVDTKLNAYLGLIQEGKVNTEAATELRKWLENEIGENDAELSNADFLAEMIRLSQEEEVAREIH